MRFAAAFPQFHCTKGVSRISQLVKLKFELLFGNVEFRRQHEFLHEFIYPTLGLEDGARLTLEDVVRLSEHLNNLSPECRIVGLEESDGAEILKTEIWESYGDEYHWDWVERAKDKFKPEASVVVFVSLPDHVWKRL